MWQAFAVISFLTLTASLIGILVGLIIGIARKRWTTIKYCSVIFGIVLVLIIIISNVAPDGSFDTSESENAIEEALKPTATPEPTSTPEPPPVPDIIERGELHHSHWFEAHERCDISKAQRWNDDTYDDIVTSRLAMSVVFETVLGGEDEYLPTPDEIEELGGFLNDTRSFQVSDWGNLYELKVGIASFMKMFNSIYLAHNPDSEISSKTEESADSLENQFYCRTVEMRSLYSPSESTEDVIRTADAGKDELVSVTATATFPPTVIPPAIPTTVPPTATPEPTAIPVPEIVRIDEDARDIWEKAEERCDKGKMRDYVKDASVEAIAGLVELRASVAKSRNSADASDYNKLPTEMEIELLKKFLNDSPEAFSRGDWTELYDIHGRLIFTGSVLMLNLMEMGTDKSSVSSFAEGIKVVNNQFDCRTAELQRH